MEKHDHIGDNHILTSVETPLVANAFDKSDDEKIANIQGYFSKINRLVDYYAHRPQVQERLCLQILKDLQETLGTEDVIVIISAKHLCVSSRGIKDKSSYTTTVEYGGTFENTAIRNEFFKICDFKDE